MPAPLTMLNDAMLLQCTAQLQAPTPALCLTILKEPVDQLVARKGSLICHTVLLSELQDGVLVPNETEGSKTQKTQIGFPITGKLLCKSGRVI